MVSIIVPIYKEKKEDVLRFVAHIADFESSVDLVFVSAVQDNTTYAYLVDASGFFEKNGGRISLVQSHKLGRGPQFNYGKNVALHDWLFFCHVDAVLPSNFLDVFKSFCKTFGYSHRQAGAFSLVIKGADSLGWLDTCFLAFISLMTSYRSRLLSSPYGDQGLLIHRQLFEEVGGYDEEGFLEDVLMCRSLKKIGCNITIFSDVIETSARKWESFGMLKTTLKHRLIMLMFLARFSPKTIRKFLAKI